MPYLHSMNTKDFDLNLLLVFDAVRRHGTVSKAADALGSPQSTVSNALGRLRAAFADPLFVRSGNGMLPTPFAEQIAPLVAEGLKSIDLGLRQSPDFDARTARREFTVIMSDIAEVVVLPRLLDACRETAPAISFRTQQMPMNEILGALRSGGVDLALGFIPQLRGAMRQLLFESSYVVIARRTTGSAGRPMDRATFLQRRHAVAILQGTGHSIVERTLSRFGLDDQIGARVPNFLALPPIVASSDMLATVPRPLALLMQGIAKVDIYEHPLPLRPFPVNQFWHERYNWDPANRWLRETLRKAVAGVSLLHGGARRRR